MGKVYIDHVSMPFAIDRKTIHEVNLWKAEKRDHRVCVANPGTGLDNHQCTLQVCISLESKVRIAIIFRGSGKRISADEIKAYHPNIDVYWQEKAWADTKFNVEWVRQTLKEGTKPLEGKEFVLFCDNLTSQVSEEFLQVVREINGIVWFGVIGVPDIWQPVDCDIGRMLKQTVSRIQDEWLEHDDNIDLWLGNCEEKLTAKKRRMLITLWVGEAYSKLIGDDYSKSR